MSKGAGKGLHPNSRKNLKPVQPGEIRNPLGGRAHNPEKRRIRAITEETLKDVVELALISDLKGLEAIIRNPETPAIKVGVATSLVKAIRKGDWRILEAIIERLTGKVAIRVHHEGGTENRTTVVDEVALKAAMKKIEDDV